jgi:Tol biopolymer transport system component
LISGPAGEDRSGIWIIPVIGGALRQLRTEVTEADIAPDGTLVAFLSHRRIWLMPAAGGEEPRLFAAPETGYSFEKLRWSRDGRWLAYLKRRAGATAEAAIEARGRDGHPVVVFSAPRLENLDWGAEGRIIYQVTEPYPDEASSNLWEVTTDSATGRALGEPRRITDWAGVTIHGNGFNVSADGKRIAFVRTRWSSDVYVGELKADGQRLEAVRRLTLDDRLDWPAAWTPDSRAILFYSDRNGNFDIFQQGLDTRTAVPIVIGPDEERGPQFSSHGSWILYLTWPRKPGAPPETGRLMRLPTGGGPAERVLEFKGYPGSAQGEGRTISKGEPDFRCASGRPGSCVLREADQEQIVFTTFDPTQGRKADGRRTSMTRGPEAVPSAWDLSPDGSQVASIVDARGCRIRILPLAGGASHDVVVHGWSRCDTLAWAADGRSLFASSFSVKGSSLLHVELGGEARLLRKATKWFERPLPSPDGRSMAFGEMTPESNAWILEDSG